MPDLPAQPTTSALPTGARALSPPTDLTARREAAARAVRAAAHAPVRHLPAALLDALQGSWGSPAELLGAPGPVAVLAAAR